MVHRVPTERGREVTVARGNTKTRRRDVSKNSATSARANEIFIEQPIIIIPLTVEQLSFSRHTRASC